LGPHWSAAYIWACHSGPFAPLLATTLVYAEKVRPQFLSLRQLAQGRVFSTRSRWQFSPVAVAVSNSSSGLSTVTTALLFSETAVSLRTSALRSFDTVLEFRSFRVTCKLQREEVRPLLSDRREPPILVPSGCCQAHNLKVTGSNPVPRGRLFVFQESPHSRDGRRNRWLEAP
jgi:hypothetical protein